eukprot:10918672-Heterocapsa_arctica.AAC.1
MDFDDDELHEAEMWLGEEAQMRAVEEAEEYEGKVVRRRLKEKTTKRPRDLEMIEEQEMEEVLAR